MVLVSDQIDVPGSHHGEIQTFLARSHGHFIGGRWIQGGDTTPINVVNPATGISVAHVEAGGAVEVDLAVTAARASFDSGVWVQMAPVERARILFSLADLIEDHAGQIAHLEALDTGVSRAMMHDIGVKLSTTPTSILTAVNY